MLSTLRTASRLYKAARSIWSRRSSLKSQRLARQSILISGGAAASTSALALLEPFGWNSRADKDGLKHLPNIDPLRPVSAQTRIVFVTRDPEATVASLHHRGYCRHQALKLALSARESVRLLLLGHEALHRWLVVALERQAKSFKLAARENDNVDVLSFHDLIAQDWKKSTLFTRAERGALKALDSLHMESRRLRTDGKPATSRQTEPKRASFLRL